MKCGCAPNLGRANRLRRCAIPRRHSPILCAASCTVAPPFIDGRKSVPSTALANMCANIGVSGTPTSANSMPHHAITHRNLAACVRPPEQSHLRFSMVENRSRRSPAPTCGASIGVTGYPRSGKLPAPSRHRSPTLSQAVRGGRLTPAAASRWSKIGPIDRPSQHACKHRCDRIPKVRQTARAVAPSLSHTLAGCARPRGRSPDTKDGAIKKCSARLLTDSQGRPPAKVEYALRAITWVLAFACTPSQWAAHRSLCVGN